MNYWKTILIEIKCFASNFFHGWLPSCILWLLLVNFPILGGGGGIDKTQPRLHLSPQDDL